MNNNKLFISYAQNYEDVMLWRALKHIENGFYIDVGANDPKEDSVTKAFYDFGWSGINIEPVVRFYKRLQNHRPRDLNLNCAVSSEAGEVTIYDVDVRGWATLEKSVADNFKFKGKTTQSYTVEARTLKDICRDCTKGEIHFLKIDVEGFEPEVLKGADFTKFKPWIVVIESTQPDSQVEEYEKWEEILIRADYSFAFFDGINRYYISQEHCELHSHFRCPPNVFDDFIKNNHYEALILAQQSQEEKLRAEKRAKEAEARAKEAEARAKEAEARAKEAKARPKKAEARVENLIAAQSSKITDPHGSLYDFVRFHKKRGIRFYCKQILKRFESFVRRQPALNLVFLEILKVFPALRKIIEAPTCNLKSKKSYQINLLLDLDYLIGRVQGNDTTQKNQLNAKKSSPHLVIDLTPLLPGGENGGIKPYIFECIPWLRKRFKHGLHITFLTSSISHEEVRSNLLGLGDSIVCVNINSPHHPLEFQGRGDRDFLWRSPPSDILSQLNADLLYCPFGATTYHCPGIPTIATVVDLLHIDYPAAISSAECSHRDAYFKKMSVDADAFQCISDYGVSRLAEVYNIPTERICRTHLGVADRFKKSTKPNFNSASKSFFYPANFWPHKNHLTLLVAYANYVARIGNEGWDLILTGFDSPEARIVLGYSETLGIKGRVRYEGHVSEERLADIWSSSSALIFPSLHEGFGIPLVEAMSYKLPIICGSTTCLQEVAGNAAVFVDASKPTEIADAMLRLSTDQELWETLSANATSRFKAFSFDTEMEKLAQKIELLTKDYPTRVTVSGVDEGCRLARQMFFAASSKGTLHLRTIMKAVGGDARLRLRCGHRFFGSWLLTADQEQTIEVNVFSDGKPFSFEYASDGEFGSTLQFVTCHSLSVKNPASHFTEEILPQK